MAKTTTRWVVRSYGAYLQNARKAVEGYGMDGGFTEDVRKARKYTSRNTASAVARTILCGEVERVAPRGSR